MSEHSRYYLIDFENVGLDGLSGAEKFSQGDYIHLFSTKNAAKISTAILSDFNATNLIVHEVPVGSQSADMHLVSFLGYLIGKEGASGQYTVISKDTDYDNIIHFWKAERNITIQRRDRLQPTQKVSPPRNQTAKQAKTDPPGQMASADRIKLNASVQQALSKAKYGNDIIGKTASLIVQLRAKDEEKNAIYRAIVANYGQKVGLDIYNRIKKLL